MSTTVLAIDPGLSGAVAVIGTDIFDVADLPVLETIKAGKTKTGKKKKKREIDIELFAIRFIQLQKEYEPQLIIIENVHSMPGQGIAGSFTFGQTLGRLEGIIRSLNTGARIQYVTPQAWKKYHGILKQGKDGSVALCRLHYPLLTDIFMKSKDGRADAVLMAEYGQSLNI